MPAHTINVLRAGDYGVKQDPFTIAIIANPALEAPWNSGTFISDPITLNQAGFDASAKYVDDSLFGLLPNQGENQLGDPAIAPHVRVVTLFVPGLNPQDANALVGQDGVSNLLIARRNKFIPFLANYGLQADVAYAVSASASHDRATAWYTTDDDSRPGVPFVVDGMTLNHRFYYLIPGTTAIHITSHALTALHEFGHAFSSYTNGKIVDLYVDSGTDFNNKRGRPIPAAFATYSGVGYNSDMVRDGIGYPASWQSYHCELHDPALPAVMDNYWLAPSGVPEHCLHDTITRQFIRDRVLAKISRP